MSAQANLPVTINIAGIAMAAGTKDFTTYRYDPPLLIVDDVTQAVLDAAVAAYNDAAYQAQISAATAAGNVIASGVQIASASNAAVNGTYACQGQDWQDMRDEAQYIQTFGAFSGGLQTLSWTMPNGTVTGFTATTQFLSVVRGIGDFLTGVKQFTAGQVSALPPQPVSIS